MRALLAHGEEGLAQRAPSVSDEELQSIGERASNYAFSLNREPGMGGLRAISLAAVEVFEGSSRELHKQDTRRPGPFVEAEELRRLGLGH